MLVRRLMENVRSVVLALLLGFGIRIGVAQAYEIEGPSMEPSIVEGDRVWVARCAFGLSLPFMTHSVVQWSLPEPGDVVIAQSPFDEEDVVKRVIGVPGDTIELRDGALYRNGEALRRTSVGGCDPNSQLQLDPTCEVYEEQIGEVTFRVSQSSQYEPESRAFVVPEGHVFLVGDHRDRSNDSRTFGPVAVTRVRGLALGY